MGQHFFFFFFFFFALAREIIHDHENVYFPKTGYLFMKILSQVSHLCNLIMTLSIHDEIPRILNFCGKIFTSLS